MSNYARFTDAERKAWGAKMAAARAAKKVERERSYVSGRGTYKRKYAKTKPKRAPSKQMVVRGKGAYTRESADSLGKQWGGTAGAYLGELAGSALGSILGLGAYEVRKNAILQDPPPIINIDKRGGTCIRHREFLGDVITGTAGSFKIQAFPLNPGQETTFPWLAQVAANYEEYALEGCIFEFRSMSADALNSTNTALGTVIMATNYNPGNPNFTNKAEMENYEYGCSAKPSESIMHPIECDPKQTVNPLLFVRPGTVPTGQSIQLFDWGNFQIATSGFQGSNVNIGELWITYQVTLLKPKMYASLGMYNEFFRWSNSTSVAAGTPLGTPSAGSIVAGSNSNLDITVATASTVLLNDAIFTQQQYLVIITWVGGAAALVAPALTFSNCVAGSFAANQVPSSGTSDTTLQLQFTVVTDGKGVTPAFILGVGGTLPTVSPIVSLRIIQIGNSYNL